VAIYAPPQGKAAEARQAEPATQRGTGTEPPTLSAGDERSEALATMLNGRPQVRQMKIQSESLSEGRARIPAPTPVQKPGNRTGLPDALKEGVETLSGFAMDDVRVHYNSARPATLGALAYAQGTDIHVGPGQAGHLPHEAWHVVQQKQGRVKPTIQAKGADINDDAGLEREATAMGALATGMPDPASAERSGRPRSIAGPKTIVQLQLGPALGSDAVLAAQYAVLLGSAAFQELDNVVTAKTAITLVDSGGALGDQGVDYDSSTHTIRVPVTDALGAANPLADVNANLLFEMHNARKRGELGRTERKIPVLAPNASMKEKADFPRKMAVYAISKEWEEWVNAAEVFKRADRIDTDIGAGTVTAQAAPFFPANGTGWYLFSNYLTYNVGSGHTAGYDATANNPQWIGFNILKEKANSVAVKLTPTELNKWAAGDRKSHVKKSNPFK
jgi:hypothetical protein